MKMIRLVIGLFGPIETFRFTIDTMTIDVKKRYALLKVIFVILL